MPTRRVLRGVLCNFLGTYTSRYSEYDGYWLFGLLIKELGGANLDLLALNADTEDLLGAAHELAAREFADQLTKSRLDSAWVVAARLNIEVGPPEMLTSTASGDARGGWNLRFVVSATTDTGSRFECERTILVAPHDPTHESRSARLSIRARPRVSGHLDE